MLFVVVSKLPLRQIQEVVVVLTRSQQLARELKHFEQTPIRLFVHTLLSIVLFVAPCAEAFKQPFALSCKLTVWQTQPRVRSYAQWLPSLLGRYSKCCSVVVTIGCGVSNHKYIAIGSGCHKYQIARSFSL